MQVLAASGNLYPFFQGVAPQAKMKYVIFPGPSGFVVGRITGRFAQSVRFLRNCCDVQRMTDEKMSGLFRVAFGVVTV